MVTRNHYIEPNKKEIDNQERVIHKDWLTKAFMSGGLEATIAHYKDLIPELVKETIEKGAKAGEEGNKASELLGKIIDVVPEALNAEHVELAIKQYGKAEPDDKKANEAVLKQVINGVKDQDLKNVYRSCSNGERLLLRLALDQRGIHVEQGSRGLG